MEEGSLLQQALKPGEQSASDNTKCLLLVDVFSLTSKERGQIVESLIRLAKLAVEFNEFLQAQEFHWHNGGDGPVFGIHYTGGIPHLRAYCRYGPNVSDEWTMIQFMLTLSKRYSNEVAISCWDAEDGQVILIQTWQVLPPWFDEDPSDSHRYACWLCAGQLQLFQRRHLTLQDALSSLKRLDPQSLSSNPKVHTALTKWLNLNSEHSSLVQRTPLVVPRKIARLIRNRPDLVHAAIQAFCDNIEASQPDLGEYEDWIWATHQIARTNYAMLRTVVSSKWQTIEDIPPVPVEVKRFKRQCAMEATPHVQHALRLGVRLVAGFEFLSRQESECISMDERIIRWSRIADDVGDEDGSCLLESFQQGPNHSKYDLTDILKCPVFLDENKSLTAFSRPNQSLKEQISQGKKTGDEIEDQPIPSESDVDSEDWLALSSDGGQAPENDLDSLLSRFQKFMTDQSDIEGIATSSIPRQYARSDIRPNVFMNILKTALQGKPLSFPNADDPFFFREDYDLMETQPDAEDGKDVTQMMDLMVRKPSYWHRTSAEM